MSLIKVVFPRYDGSWGDWEYTYRCDFPVELHDIVKVEAGPENEIKFVMVTALDVPIESVPVSIRPRIRSVIEKAELPGAPVKSPPQAGKGNQMTEEMAIVEQTAPETEELVSIKQIPIIVERFAQARELVLARVAEAKSLQATEDTIKAVKAYRAQLRKEKEQLDRVRIEVKRAIMAPYEAVEKSYAENIGSLFEDADRDLKQKIDSVENGWRNNCREKCREYFNEACRAHGFDFLNFDQMDISISLTDAKKKEQPPKSIRLKMDDIISRVSDDLDSISHMEDAGEILAEYKAHLSLSGAVNTVRYNKEQRERAAREAQERAERARLEQERAQAIRAAAEAASVSVSPLTPVSAENVAATVQVSQPAPEAVQPVQTVQSEEELLTINFIATGTRAQLIELRDFIREKGIRISYGQ